MSSMSEIYFWPHLVGSGPDTLLHKNPLQIVTTQVLLEQPGDKKV